jgi:hypothetical protein
MVLWFRNDLRLHDNAIVAEAVKAVRAKQVDEVVPVYCYDPRFFKVRGSACACAPTCATSACACAPTCATSACACAPTCATSAFGITSRCQLRPCGHLWSTCGPSMAHLCIWLQRTMHAALVVCVLWQHAALQQVPCTRVMSHAACVW